MIDLDTTSFVSRMTWTDADGVDWIIQVRNAGDVEFSARIADPESTAMVEQGKFVMSKEAFVRLCPAMARVIEGVYA